MATVTQVINEAKKYLGDGGKRFCDAYGSGMVNWCCIFVWYVMRQCGAGKLFCDGEKVAWVPTAQEWLASHCEQIKLTNAKAGDIVVFSWGGGSRDHIGFAIKPISSGLQTIEGNTGSNDFERSTVQIRERPASVIYGIYRPKYQQEQKQTTTYGEIRKYKCIQVCHGYKKPAVASGRIGKDTTVGSVYSATAWERDFVKIPYLGNGWFPVSGSGGVYLERIQRIRYVVTNATGVNVYADHSNKSKKLETVEPGAFLTVTKWFGKWGYVPAVKGWVAMSCLSEETAGTRIYRDCAINAKKLVAANVHYSADCPPTTLAGAIKEKKTDCAHYASFAYQDEGILPVGQYVWLNKHINGNGADDIIKSDRVKIYYNVGKTAKEIRVPFGAMVGYGYTYKTKSGKVKSGQHTQIGAGYTSAGNPLWWSGGVTDVNGKSYGPKRKTTYEDRPIDVMIVPL